MKRVYIAIGSNLNNPLKQVIGAIKKIKNLSDTNFIKSSSFYRSKPMGRILDQPDYLNAVVSIDTDLSPDILLEYMHFFEFLHGRIRTFKWASRNLDLDILLYDNEIIQTKRLTIPHYGIKKRSFVLYPLFEIEPNLCFPDGELLSSRIKKVLMNDLTLW
ncbi:MAG: 2-amino-4-hydroxy-6-hydroxymethyldihydropteridine diphosphokinase [Arsenophonus sp.]|nr:MAG: 2-amino-4-hydroxy-6-hydroxymethyldihydropteridine diphosphokinase [Arsenophonus sp.]